ncbi:hypothetical protein HN873_042364 [Arachis hypogaea]
MHRFNNRFYFAKLKCALDPKLKHISLKGCIIEKVKGVRSTYGVFYDCWDNVIGLSPTKCLGLALLRDGLLWNRHLDFWVAHILACTIYYGLSINFLNKSVLGI